MSVSLPPATQAQVNQDVAEIYQTRYMGFVSFTILVWDHIITFPAEVEFIWKRSKGPLVYLFLINRYVIPLGFIVNLVAYNLEYWPDMTCERYVRYEGVMTNFGVEVVGLMMLIRLHALYYDKSRLVIAFVALILIGETATNVYLLKNGIAVPHRIYQNQVHSCSMIYHAPPTASAASAWIPLLYDTIVLILTLYVTVPSILRSEKGSVVRIILKDGLLYYVAICSVTLVLTIMIFAAPPGLKNITAQLELLLTVTMMSRITIHLKEQLRTAGFVSHRRDEMAANTTFSRDRSYSDVMGQKRSRSSASSSGFSDLGITFVRPEPAHFMSTIWSERNSGSQTPVTSDRSLSSSDDVGEIVSARLRERQEQSEQSTAPIWTSQGKDEESL